MVAAACSTSDNSNSSDTTAGGSAGTQASSGSASAGSSAAGNADLKGKEVTVFGSESSDEEAGAMQDALNVLGDQTGMKITFVGARDFEQQINSQVTGGNPPDIAIFPQPGKLRDFATSGDLKDLPDDVLATAKDNWSDSWLKFWQTADGKQVGVPVKSDLKSLVWYSPAAFKAKGYEVPKTKKDFFTLVDTMIANGDTPLCVGIESGPATGWPFTDWVEELILREKGIDFYNDWVSHKVPFNDPAVVAAFKEVSELWAKPKAVYAAGGSIAATPFGDNAQALTDGKCMMHRQANFFASFFPEGTKFGDAEGAIDTFYFPSDEGAPVLVAGTSAAAFRDAPEVWAVMNYYASSDYANNRQAAQLKRKGQTAGQDISGFLSAAKGADPNSYSPLEKGFLDVLATGDPAGFDASDQMPGAVGSGTFWQQATALVNGQVTPQAAADTIEASWPAS